MKCLILYKAYSYFLRYQIDVDNNEKQTIQIINGFILKNNDKYAKQTERRLWNIFVGFQSSTLHVSC